MADNSIALQVDAPDFGNSFSRGAAQAQDRQINSMKMDMAQKEQGREDAMELMNLMGSIGLGSMGGDINGQADPAKWEQGLDYLDSLGVGLETQRYRGKPQLARMLVDASISAADRLKMARDDRDFALALQKFDQDLNQQQEATDLRREGLDIQRQRLENTQNKKTPLSATAQKELFEADESIEAGTSVLSALDRALELNDKAYAGPMADARGWASSQFGSEGGVATQDLKNIVTTQALDNLKAVFGGMPTEGERKILLEIQGSVDQAPEVRKGIFERAKVLAEKRIAFNRKKATALRSGDYFTGDFSDPASTEAPASPEGEKAVEDMSDAELEALINGE